MAQFYHLRKAIEFITFVSCNYFHTRKWLFLMSKQNNLLNKYFGDLIWNGQTRLLASLVLPQVYVLGHHCSSDTLLPQKYSHTCIFLTPNMFCLLCNWSKQCMNTCQMFSKHFHICPAVIFVNNFTSQGRGKCGFHVNKTSVITY